jgi:flagellar export protein FliJ
MPKFTFRLAKLLEYRGLQEKWAKDEYLLCRAKRIEGENQIEGLKHKRATAMSKNYETIQDKKAQEAFTSRLDDDRRAVEAAVAVLAGEEEVAKQHWLKAKRDAEALEKLEQKDLDAWSLEERRKAQKELDEWALRKRAS